MSSSYGFVHLAHLLCAISFIGVVFFELAILEGMRAPLGPERMAALEQALINRAKWIMPWVVATLFLSGAGLAWFHRAALLQGPASSFGTMLGAKILIALSVGGHLIYALKTASDGCMNSRKFKLLHFSVATHMVGIVVLAKAMFYLHW